MPPHLIFNITGVQLPLLKTLPLKEKPFFYSFNFHAWNKSNLELANIYKIFAIVSKYEQLVHF